MIWAMPSSLFGVTLYPTGRSSDVSRVMEHGGEQRGRPPALMRRLVAWRVSVIGSSDERAPLRFRRKPEALGAGEPSITPTDSCGRAGPCPRLFSAQH